MRRVLAPIDQSGPVVLVRFAIAIGFYLAIPTVQFRHWRDKGYDAVAKLSDKWRLFHGQAISQLHQHLGRSRFRRVDRPRQVIDRFPRRDQPLRRVVGQPARIRECRGDGAIVFELGDSGRIGDGGDDHRSSLITGAEVEDLHASGGAVERAEVARDVGDVRESANGSWDVAEDLQRRGNPRVGGEMIGELGVEARLSRQLPDFGAVRGVEWLLEREEGEEGVYHATFSGMRDKPAFKKSTSNELNSPGDSSAGECPVRGTTTNAARGGSPASRLPVRTGIHRSASPQTINVGACSAPRRPASVSNLNSRNTPRKARP